MKKIFRVEELAKERGLTQLELFQLIQKQGANVSLGTIQRIWQNARAVEPRASTLFAIARALGVSITDLYVGGEPPYTDEHMQTTGHVAQALEGALT